MVGKKRTAWPLLRGLMSRKASVLSVSRILKQGISPGVDGTRSASRIDSCIGSLDRAPSLMGARWIDLPLMILQKMQDAILLAIEVCEGGGRGKSIREGQSDVALRSPAKVQLRAVVQTGRIATQRGSTSTGAGAG